MSQIAEGALILLLLSALGVCVWANGRMMKRAREAGYHYWLINPKSALAAINGVEPIVFIIAVLVGFLAFVGLQTLR
jgi:hypothetical protein